MLQSMPDPRPQSPAPGLPGAPGAHGIVAQTRTVRTSGPGPATAQPPCSGASVRGRRSSAKVMNYILHIT